MIKLLLSITLASFLLALAPPASAQQPDAAPFAGKCFGEGTSTCLVPALSFDVATVALTGANAGKFSAGAIPVGAGYALLFGYDQWWAAGPALHGIFDLSQAEANFVQIAGLLTFARYFHVGVLWSILGESRTLYGAAGLDVPFDLVTTKVAEKRAGAVRAARAAAPPKE